MRVVSTLGCTSCVATPLGDVAPVGPNTPADNAAVVTAVGPQATTAMPGAEKTSVLYRFGMSPKLWALVAGALGVGGYLLHRRSKKARR